MSIPDALCASTQRLLALVVDEFVARGRCFCARDVSNEVRTRGMTEAPPSGEGRHRTMARALESRFLGGGMPGYEAFLVIAARGEDASVLYQPHGTPYAVSATIAGRPVAVVASVEVQRAAEAHAVDPRRRRMQHLREAVAEIGAPVVPDGAPERV